MHLYIKAKMFFLPLVHAYLKSFLYTDLTEVYVYIFILRYMYYVYFTILIILTNELKHVDSLVTATEFKMLIK